MRILVAVIAGMVVGALCIILLESVAHKIHPLPEGVDLADPLVIQKHMATAPVSAMMLVVAGHFLAGIFGNIVVLLIAQRKRIGAVIFSLLLIVATCANAFMLPHPIWFVIVDIVAVLAAIFIVFRLIKKPAK